MLDDLFGEMATHKAHSSVQKASDGDNFLGGIICVIGLIGLVVYGVSFLFGSSTPAASAQRKAEQRIEQAEKSKTEKVASWVGDKTVKVAKGFYSGVKGAMED